MAETTTITAPTQEGPQAPPSKLKTLWKNLGSKNPTFNRTFEEFKLDMTDETKRHALWETLSNSGTGFTRTFEEFTSDIMPPKKKEPTPSEPLVGPSPYVEPEKPQIVDLKGLGESIEANKGQLQALSEQAKEVTTQEELDAIRSSWSELADQTQKQIDTYNKTIGQVNQVPPTGTPKRDEGLVYYSVPGPFGSTFHRMVPKKDATALDKGIAQAQAQIAASDYGVALADNIKMIQAAEDWVEILKDKDPNEVVGGRKVKEWRDMFLAKQRELGNKAVENYERATKIMARTHGVGKDIPETASEAFKSPEAFGKFAAASIGQAGPQMIHSLTTLGAGGFFLETGLVQMDMIDKLAQETGMRPEEIIRQALVDPDYAIGAGLVAGTLDFISLGILAKATGLPQLGKRMITKYLSKASTKKAIKEGTKRGIARQIGAAAVTGGLTEGITEPMQGVVEEIGATLGIEQPQTPQEFIEALKKTDISFEQMATESLAGGIPGLLFGGFGRTTTLGRPSSAVEQEISVTEANQQMLEEAQAAQEAQKIQEEQVVEETTPAPPAEPVAEKAPKADLETLIKEAQAPAKEKVAPKAPAKKTKASVPKQKKEPVKKKTVKPAEKPVEKKKSPVAKKKEVPESVQRAVKEKKPQTQVKAEMAKEDLAQAKKEGEKLKNVVEYKESQKERTDQANKEFYQNEGRKEYLDFKAKVYGIIASMTEKNKNKIVSQLEKIQSQLEEKRRIADKAHYEGKAVDYRGEQDNEAQRLEGWRSADDMTFHVDLSAAIEDPQFTIEFHNVVDEYIMAPYEEKAESKPKTTEIVGATTKFPDNPKIGDKVVQRMVPEDKGDVYEYKNVDPTKLEYEETELSYDEVVAMPSTQEYIKKYKKGEVPPPIIVLQRKPGEFSSLNRRRIVAAREAGVKSIPAWVEAAPLKKAPARKKPKSIQQKAKELLGKYTPPPNPKNTKDKYGRITSGKIHLYHSTAGLKNLASILKNGLKISTMKAVGGTGFAKVNQQYREHDSYVVFEIDVNDPRLSGNYGQISEGSEVTINKDLKPSEIVFSSGLAGPKNNLTNELTPIAFTLEQIIKGGKLRKNQEQINELKKRGIILPEDVWSLLEEDAKSIEQQKEPSPVKKAPSKPKAKKPAVKVPREAPPAPKKEAPKPKITEEQRELQQAEANVETIEMAIEDAEAEIQSLKADKKTMMQSAEYKKADSDTKADMREEANDYIEDAQETLRDAKAELREEKRELKKAQKKAEKAIPKEKPAPVKEPAPAKLAKPEEGATYVEENPATGRRTTFEFQDGKWKFKDTKGNWVAETPGRQEAITQKFSEMVVPTKRQAAKQKLDKAFKEAVEHEKTPLGIAATPENMARQEYESYKKWFAVAKAAAEYGIATLEELAQQYKLKINEVMRKAWDDARVNNLGEPVNEKDYAVQKRSTKKVPVRKAPGDRKEVEQEVRKPKEPTKEKAKKKAVSPVRKGQKVYDNNAILSGRKKTSGINVKPGSMQDKDLAYDEISNELTFSHAKQIIETHGIDVAEATAMDLENDMLPVLRRALLIEVSKAHKRVGNQKRSDRAYLAYKNLGGESAQAIQYGNQILKDAEMQLLDYEFRLREQNNEARQAPMPGGQTVGEVIDTSMGGLEELSSNQVDEFLEKPEVKKRIEKIVEKHKPKEPRKKPVTKKQKLRGKQRLDAAWDKLMKDSKGQMNASIFGITPAHTEFLAEATKALIEMGADTLADVYAGIRRGIKDHFETKDKVEFHSKSHAAIKNAYFQKLLEEGEYEKAASEFIKTQKKLINETVQKHYSLQDQDKRKLSEKLIDIGNLSKEEAKQLERLVSKEFREEAGRQILQIVDKLNIAQEGKKKQPKNTKDMTEKIISAINIGQFDQAWLESYLTEKFGHKYDFSNVTQEFLDQAHALLDDMAQIEMEQTKRLEQLEAGIGNRKQLSKSLAKETLAYKEAAQRLNAWLNKRKKLGTKLREAFLDMWYLSVLSGFSTFARSIKGMMITGGLHATSALGTLAFRDPSMIWEAGLKPLTSKVFSRQAAQIFRDVVLRGQTDLDLLGRKAVPLGFTAQLAQKSFGSILSDPKLTPAEKTGLFIAKGFLALPTYMVRGFIGADAIIKLGLSEMETAILVNEQINQEKHDPAVFNKMKEFKDRMGYDKAAQEAITKIAKEEQKVKGKSNRYFQRRRRELLLALRDAEIMLKANEKAKEGLLMNEPRGVIGDAYRRINSALIGKEGDSWQKTFIRTALRTVFPFLRVPSNLANMGLNHTPLGYLWLQSKELTAEERARHVFQATAGTAVGVGIFAWMFDYDDEEEKWVLNEDVPFYLTAEGSGNYIENLSRNPDHKNWSLVMKDSGNVYTFVDNPIGYWLAPMAIMSDELRYSNFKKRAVDPYDPNYDPVGREFWDIFGAMPLAMAKFAGSQSYSQGMSQITQLLGDSSEEGAIKAFGKRVSAGFTPLVMPNLYRQIYGIYKGRSEIPERAYYAPDKPMETVLGKASKDAVWFQEMLLDGIDYDILGYPVIRRSELGMIPDALMRQVVENIDYREGLKEWQLIYKFDQVGLGRHFRPPERLEGAEELSEFQKMAGLELRKILNNNYDMLNAIKEPVVLQFSLNKMKADAQANANAKWKAQQAQ